MRAARVFHLKGMSNLLSSDSLDIRRLEYAHKILFGIFSVVGLTALLGFIILLPSYISIRGDRISIEAQNEAIAESVSVSQSNKDRDDLIDARKRIESLEKVLSGGNVPTEVLGAIIDRRPSGLTIDAIQYVSKDGKETSRISGTINSRAQLQAYVSSLESDKLFDSVNVPVSALADADEGLFVITTSGI
jgi:hypothetical protein